MKVLCKYSGIEFACDHFPGYLTSGEYYHPIFAMPLPKLWKYFPKWQAAELTDTDSYLLFIAYLNATDMVDFRTAVQRTTDTNAIVSSQMENLFYTIGRVITIKHPSFSIPRFVITRDTCTLSNVRYWIQTWQECYDDFTNGLKDVELRANLERKALNLQRMIKNPSLNPSKYAHILAQWCSEAAEFPLFQMKDPSGNETTLSEYWQELIVKCHTNTSVITIRESDLVELIEHCETNLDGGSIQAYHLFDTIRSGLDMLKGFFSIGSTSFSILQDGDDVGTSNLQLLIDSAPLTPPKRTEYTSEFQFIKAKMKYSLALANGNGNGGVNGNGNSIEEKL